MPPRVPLFRTVISIGVTILSLLLLAACGGNSSTGPETPASRDGLIEVRVAVADEVIETLTAQGRQAIDQYSLVVLDEGAPLPFSSENVFDPAGSRKVISLDPRNPGATLFLPARDHELTFVLYGFEDEEGALIGYGETAQHVTSDTRSIPLNIQTVLKTATLKPRTPISAATPGDEFELLLNVAAPGDAAPAAAMSDFEVEYVVDASQAHVVNSSKRGLRVSALEAAVGSRIEITAIVSGFIAGAHGEMDERLPMLPVRPKDGTLEASFDVRVLNRSGAWFDNTPPSVELDWPDVVRTGESINLTGRASDDVAIAQFQVYEGARLVGSTDPEQLSAGVNEIVFDGTSWTVEWSATRESRFELEAVATDTAGNETSVRHEIYAWDNLLEVSEEPGVPAAVLSLDPGESVSFQLALPATRATAVGALYIELDAELTLEVDTGRDTFVSSQPSIFSRSAAIGHVEHVRTGSGLTECLGPCVLLPAPTGDVI